MDKTKHTLVQKYSRTAESTQCFSQIKKATRVQLDTLFWLRFIHHHHHHRHHRLQYLSLLPLNFNFS